MKSFLPLILLLTHLGVLHTNAQTQSKVLSLPDSLPSTIEQHSSDNDSTQIEAVTNEEHPEINKLSPSQRLMRTKLLERKAKEVKEVYTCPQHPEITADTTGTCPKCGTDLVKQTENATTVEPDTKKTKTKSKSSKKK